MKPENSEQVDLRVRTRQYALRIIRLYSSLPKTNPERILGKQLLRSGTSVGAQYAESCRSKSHRDFINKIEGATQELEETLYWFNLLQEADLVAQEKLTDLCEETNELIAIFVSMVTSAKRSLKT